MSHLKQTIKRGFDIVASAAGLLVFSPLLIFIIVAICRDSGGPPLFLQTRLGKKGSAFKAYKFRTMIVNAPDIRNTDGSTFNAEDDPRVTKIGRLLRRTSLDELPQLLNVLAGSMSLVGPRPDQLDQIKFYTEAEKRRLDVKPGITGLAQINGRNSISWEQRKQLDLEYVSQQALALDLRILLQTIPYVLCRRDVYMAQTSEKTS